MTLDPDLAQVLADEACRRHLSFKQVVNDAIRRGLASGGNSADKPPFRITAHKTTLRGGIDPEGLNKLADELDEEALLPKLRPRA
ncbi:MAG: antitoxin [Candidatus Binatia bacterium]